MAGIDALVEAFPALASLANAVGLRKTVYDEPELPADYITKANSSLVDDDRERLPLYGLPRSSSPKDLPAKLKAYRADEKGKFGGADGLETQPIGRTAKGGDRYHASVGDPESPDATVYTNPNKAIQQLYRFARLNGAAEKHGYPALQPDEVAALFLKEGRSDLGFNSISTKDGTTAGRFNKELESKYNLLPTDKNFLVALREKKRVADKLGIPFAEAWNGTGVNEAGITGKEYASGFEKHLKAARHQRNKELLDLIQRAHTDGQKFGLPLRENATQDMLRTKREEPYTKGGAVEMPQNYSKGHWSLI